MKNIHELLLATVLVLGLGACEASSDSSDPPYSSGSGSSLNAYVCDCSGDGLRAILDVQSTSVAAAAKFATKMCNNDYPGRGCTCSCSSSESSDSCYHRRPDGSCVDDGL